MSVPDRPQGDRRTSNGSVWTEKRQSERRVSPAVGQFAIQENARLREVNAELLAALSTVLAGLRNGSVKSKPLISFDENAESADMQSLEEIVSAAIAKATKP